MKKITTIYTLGLLFTVQQLFAQEKTTASFQPDSWDIKAKSHEFKEFQGKQALFLNNGTARLKDSSFKNGIIDYDLNLEQKRNFAGVHFRIQDTTNYEELYLRPHQSGNPDAMQYSPVINGNAAW